MSYAGSAPAHQSFTLDLQQAESVFFEQLISKIEAADFDPLPLLKQWNALGRYEAIKRSILIMPSLLNLFLYFIVFRNIKYRHNFLI
jgi:hypothetical protein